MAKPSAVVDTRVIHCGNNLGQLKKLPDACIDLIYIDPPFNSNRNYESSGERRRRSAHSKTATLRPRPTSSSCPHATWSWRALKKSGSFRRLALLKYLVGLGASVRNVCVRELFSKGINRDASELKLLTINEQCCYVNLVVSVAQDYVCD